MPPPVPYGIPAIMHLKTEELTFENVIEPLISEEEQVLYAFHTLWARMITDWPISEELEADFLKTLYERNDVMEKWQRRLIDFYYLQMKASGMGETPKKQEQFAAHDSFVEHYTLYERNDVMEKWQRRLIDFYYLQMKASGMGETPKKQEQFAAHDSFVEHYVLRYRMVLRDSEDMQNIEVTDGKLFRDAPPHILRQLAVGRADYMQGPWLVAASIRAIKPVLLYCSDRALRASVWENWISRAAKPRNITRVTSNGRTIESIRRHQLVRFRFPHLAYNQ
ncbi:unnamed protein product [Gongylonema pulchrum]|uniref:Uncharacterized protein n=1 Tax=Gongylonema pulchrum TaxID=637853 RepID=A0A3P7MSP4_9BILA|nr:unnamed protein product [Gongylonema pulchrum]